MSIPPSHSCSDSSAAGTQNVSTRPSPTSSKKSQRPTRLQHSPSLPNLWFPAHSRPPVPTEINTMQPTLRPSAPASPEPIRAATNILSAEPRPRHVKYASVGQRGKGTKTHARRRTERDQPHSLLLTPPLTPSSSIRTTASLNSSAAENQTSSTVADTEDGEEIEDIDPDCKRIVVLENLNRQASSEKIKAAIIDILRAEDSANAQIKDVASLFKLPSHNNDIVKGLSERYLSTQGLLYLIFWDIHVAKRVQALFLSKEIVNSLQPYLGGEVDEHGARLGFSARFLTIKALPPDIAHSSLLDGVEDTYILQVGCAPAHGTADEDTPPTQEDIAQCRLDMNCIRKFLESAGRLRFFKRGNDQNEDQNEDASIYHFEFCNMRDSKNAITELNGKSVLGRKIAICTKKMAAGQQRDLNTSIVADVFGGLIGAPGVKSQMRTRFNNIQTSAPSPTFFYTSPPVDTNNQYPHPHPHSAPLRTPNGTVDIFRLDGPNMPHSYAPGCEGHCFYCPSKQQSNMSSNNYAMHYPIPPPPPPQGPMFFAPAVGPNHGILHPYSDYYALDPQLIQSPPLPSPIVGAVGPWAVNLDPAVAAVGTNGPGYFVREGMMSPSPQYSYAPPFIRPPDQHFFQAQQQPAQAIAPLVGESPIFAHISPSLDSSPSLNDATSIVKYKQKSAHPGVADVNASLSTSGQNDRNQLNLSKIENGADTRTTVMIKNIPNKMTNLDLQNYINEVIPRRIDFMYLRIDFRNGCNVGYAFVNFITVQDLLYFAKQRLGKKWDMFASQKVLQMSYANYQGKEALIEKFKNSNIMDERESWRPCIFYSEDGPNQGLPEPFPAPTHVSRKERNSHNRGTLFPPGSGNHSSSYGPALPSNAPPRRFVEDHRQRRIKGSSRPTTGHGGLENGSGFYRNTTAYRSK